MGDRRYIIVSGLPASGKTTLARAIASELRWPLFDKDDVLEALFDSLGVGDADWRSRLSRASDAVIAVAAGHAPNAVLVSFWRQATARQFVSGLSGQVLELHCLCDPAVAYERFSRRHRHPGHLDGHSGQGTLADFVAYTGALRLGGPLVTVNTTEPVDVSDALRAVRDAWNSAPATDARAT